MYCIVVLVIVLLAQISAIIQGSVAQAVDEAAPGWSLRADFSPSAPLVNGQRAVTSGQFEGQILDAAPLVTATAEGDDPLGRTDDQLPVLAIGVSDKLITEPPAVDDSLPILHDGQAAWYLVLRDQDYVLVDTFYGSAGGPEGGTVEPGQTITLTDPATGRRTPRTIAGVLSNGAGFYGLGTGEFRHPVLMNQPAAGQLFGAEARETSLLLRTSDGVDLAGLTARLQGVFLANGLVVSNIAEEVEASFSASNQFFRLMQGYLALGLLVGICRAGRGYGSCCAGAAAHHRCIASARIPWKHGKKSLHGREHARRC